LFVAAYFFSPIVIYLLCMLYPFAKHFLGGVLFVNSISKKNIIPENKSTDNRCLFRLLKGIFTQNLNIWFKKSYLYPQNKGLTSILLWRFNLSIAFLWFLWRVMPQAVLPHLVFAWQYLDLFLNFYLFKLNLAIQSKY